MTSHFINLQQTNLIQSFPYTRTENQKNFNMSTKYNVKMTGTKRPFNSICEIHQHASHHAHAPNPRKKQKRANKQLLYSPTSQLNKMSITSTTTTSTHTQRFVVNLSMSDIDKLFVPQTHRRSNYPIRSCRKETDYRLLSQYGHSYRSHSHLLSKPESMHCSSSSSSSTSPLPISNTEEDKQCKPSSQTNNIYLPSISHQSTATSKSSFKFEQHPINGQQVISLLSDDEDDDDKKERCMYIFVYFCVNLHFIRAFMPKLNSTKCTNLLLLSGINE